ncbi:MAG: DUF3857 domain-containing protein [Candidatus Acidiferrum sp.]
MTEGATGGEAALYGWRGGSYTFSVTRARDRICVFLLLAILLAAVGPAFAQEGRQKPAEAVDKTAKEKAATPEKDASNPELPFQIQLLETHIRFEVNGDSRKEVHTVVKINDILGAHQFARLTFDYNRAFQQVEIPLVRISHANGGTSELLPSAVMDAPNPAVEKFPAYQDVRVKSVRILGLEEGDTIDYRVITTTTKHPLAPDFWVEHTFDRTGQVLEEHYEIDLPGSRHVELRINPKAPPSSKENDGSGENASTIYRWERTYSAPEDGTASGDTAPDAFGTPDVAISTFSWEYLAIRLAELLLPGSMPVGEMKTYEESTKELNRRPEVADAVREKALSLTRDSKTDVDRLKALYDFVSTGIGTVDIPLGTTGFRSRPAVDILNSAYAIQEDKYVLFAALGAAVNLHADAALTGFCDKKAVAVPSAFKHLVVIGSTRERRYWLDPAVEVAPFGMIPPAFGKCALHLNKAFFAMNSTGHEWVSIPRTAPFPEYQKVRVEASLGSDGTLSAKVRYTLRGDNELLLRVAFHQTAKEKWKGVAGLLALSDGFRGQVTSVNVSDPMATKDPFTVEYEISQAKFVDWSKKPVRIPALLPQIGLPDPPAKQAAGEAAHAIELGTPLDVDTQMTLKLPAGTVVQAPAGTSVERDYAKFSSKYSTAANTATASRRVNFLMREIPGDRAMDYSAFVRAVQNDQGQIITLVPGGDADKNAKPVTSTPKQ